MTNIERERLEKLAIKSLSLRELWLSERQIGLTDQLAANEKVKKRWELSDPIEVIQRQIVHGKKRKV
jgi:hypothetical protein